jgi:hypothetical protein
VLDGNGDLRGAVIVSRSPGRPAAGVVESLKTEPEWLADDRGRLSELFDVLFGPAEMRHSRHPA